MLRIVALSLALSMGNTIPQGVSPAVTNTEAFAVVGVDVDRAIVVDVDLCVGFSNDAR